MSAFELDPRLAAGGHPLGMLENCRLLLKDNAHFAWFILVPEVAVVELHELSAEEYARVGVAVRELSGFVSRHFAPDKVNVAAIGNQVRQMHVHVVGRWSTDPAWPGVVWASEARRSYPPEEVARIAALVAAELGSRGPR